MNTLPTFASNKKCWQFLNRLAFGPDLACPQCQLTLQERYIRRYLWCRACRRKYRATAWHGSWLYGMKLTPRQLFVLLWCWQYKKSPDTAPLLEGAVQIDEIYFGKLKSQQAQRIVVGATEPHSGRLALRITDSRGQAALEQFVLDYVKPGSLVVSDKWWAYEELPLLGYPHESHNHSVGDYGNTNQGENIWSVSKRHARRLYGGRILTKHLEDLCREWMARQNQPSWFVSPEIYLRATLVPC
jgi:hypothetical protein